ncbi:MAG: hypothetical protein AUF79_09355 [Crenarchaeota archaeon 13_1_20CM_2_51_8]|nr:MAG: hypothetical protein AUF79_09355 [Crenarchaeota archaeon 13_1_20CM_2_51_8]
MILVAIVLLSPVLLPVVRFDTNVSPPCARERIPCPLGPDPPNGSPVFWSITAYYFGAGTYLAPNGYGFIGIEWFFIGLLVVLLLAGFLVIITQNQQPTDVIHVREVVRNNQQSQPVLGWEERLVKDILLTSFPLLSLVVSRSYLLHYQ